MALRKESTSEDAYPELLQVLLYLQPVCGIEPCINKCLSFGSRMHHGTSHMKTQQMNAYNKRLRIKKETASCEDYKLADDIWIHGPVVYLLLIRVSSSCENLTGPVSSNGSRTLLIITSGLYMWESVS